MTRSSDRRASSTPTAATALMLGLGGHSAAQKPVARHKWLKVGELDIPP